MTELTFCKIELPAAWDEGASPLPDIPYPSAAKITQGEGVDCDLALSLDQGVVCGMLPYTKQDRYTREIKLREFDAAVLENEYLRATFAIELGGRLLSLFDKKLGRELLYKNAVLQPANLGVRGAWFSGGVEWNVGVKGHNPLTCSPLFAAKGTDGNGNAVLKMYEYERIRSITYTIYAYLDEDCLRITPILENTADSDVHMYWWSNIAVPEIPGMRILVPARSVITGTSTAEGYTLERQAIPVENNVDLTYPQNISGAHDFFYDIDEHSDKWIAALGADGVGMIHCSDRTLKGRKTFVWGNSPGGRHWNDWLSQGSGSYVEIQAGITKTQLEYFTLPAGSMLCWNEYFSAYSCDPQKIHGDYSEATRLGSLKARTILQSSNPATRPEHEEPPCLYGSGWGALQQSAFGRSVSNISVFPQDSITEEQRDFMYLLQNKKLPRYCESSAPTRFAAGKQWRLLLENSLGDNWVKHYLLSVAFCAELDFKSADCEADKALSLCSCAFALRLKAAICDRLGRTDEAARYYASALENSPGCLPIAVEAGKFFTENGLDDKWLGFYAELSETDKDIGRIKLITAMAYIHTKNAPQAEKLLSAELVIPDIREGETTLSDAWFALQRLKHGDDVTPQKETEQKFPLPYNLDFRVM